MLIKYSLYNAPRSASEQNSLAFAEPRYHYTVFFPFRQCLFYTKTIREHKFLPYATFGQIAFVVYWAFRRKRIVENRWMSA
jgi:hypothetical protein